MITKSINRQKFLTKKFGAIFTSDPTLMVCVLNLGYSGNWAISLPQINLEFPDLFEAVKVESECTFLLFRVLSDSVLFLEKHNFRRFITGKKVYCSFCLSIPETARFGVKVREENYFSFEGIPGLYIIDDFISEHEQHLLLNHLKKENLVKVKNRFIKHFGYSYDYNGFDVSARCEPMPSYFSLFLKRLPCIFEQPNQFTVSKYPKNTGIPLHTDLENGFGPHIFSLSLNSPIIMDFVCDNDYPQLIQLNPRSLLIITEDSRYLFKHGIKERKTDLLENGTLSHRTDRWSIIMRNVI
eukprot:NODE_720_length_4814_cov_0.354613.p2 type:complete len:297 gc:universal NODE_720_length_4814_cov_0.354613:445-1335(+)